MYAEVELPHLPAPDVQDINDLSSLLNESLAIGGGDIGQEDVLGVLGLGADS